MNRPAKGAGPRCSGRQLTPLGQGVGTVLSEDVAAIEMTVLIEMIRDRGVDGATSSDRTAYDAILATGHVSKEEIFAAFDYALGKNVRKLLITHPEYYVPNLAIPDLVEFSKLGAFMEFCAVSCGPMTPASSIEQVKEMIDAVGPERAIISSDTGQPFSPRPPEALRVFAQCLHERGIDEDSIAQMTIRNPASLLGVGT